MARVKRGMTSHARHKKVLEQVKGRQPAANQPDVVTSLEKRRATLNDALIRLTV